MKTIKGMILFAVIATVCIMVLHPVVASLVLGWLAFKCWHMAKNA